MTPDDRTATAGFIATCDLHLADLESDAAALIEGLEWLPVASKYTVPVGRTRSALAGLQFDLRHLREAVDGLRATLPPEGKG